MKILQFGAEWCASCKVLTPLLDKVSEELGIQLEKVNVDENQELTAKSQIRSLPTTILFDGDKELRRFTGTKSIPQIKEFLQS